MTPEAGRYALDTNIAIALLNDDTSVARRWSEADEVLLPAPVYGELLFGAMRSAEARRRENLLRVITLAASMEFAGCDEDVCQHYAAVKARLAAAGRPIPANDLWVAACALAARDPRDP